MLKTQDAGDWENLAAYDISALLPNTRAHG
jgi:hypothetical protein